MPQILSTPNHPHAYDSVATFSEVEYAMLFRWNWRTGDWRVSISNSDTEEVVVTNRRLSPGGLVAEIEGGVLVAMGQDPYPREALGEELYLQYIPAEELAEDLADGPVDPDFVLVT